MKKELRYLTLGLVMSSLNALVSIAQPTLDFAKSIGSSTSDKGMSIAVDGSGNIFTTGTFTGSNVEFNPGGTSRLLSANGTVSSDFYIAKYNSSGQLAATTDAFKAGATNSDYSNKIYLDASNNVYVVGNMFGTPIYFDKAGGITGFQNGSSGKAFIAKYDNNLNIAYSIGIGGAGGIDIKDIAVDGSGNIYITGQYQGTVNFYPGTSPASTTGSVSMTSNSSSGDMFVAKYSSTGACQWAVGAGGTLSDVGLGIDYDNSGNIYVTGVYRGQNIEFNPLGTSKTLSEYGGGSTGDIFVAKYSSSGVLSDAFTLGNALQDQANGIAVDRTTGDFAITGFFPKDANPIDFDPDPSGTANVMAVGTSGTDMFVAKYNSALAYQWHKAVGSTGNEKGNNIRLTGNNLFVTGSFEGTATDFGNSNALTTAGGLDVFMAGYAFATGNCLFASSLGGTSNEEGNGITYVSNKIYVTGYFNGSGDYDPGAAVTTLTSVGSDDIFYAKYSYSSCTLSTINTQPAATATACVGASTTFTVSATGATSYQWKKGGVNVSGGTGATTASYTINPVASGDAGSYTVDVINGCGTVTSNASVLTVNTPASITTQPSSITQCSGTSATFTVVAAGTAPLTYQWQKNGSNASGTSTNASYTINPIAAGDAGNYTVIVNNVCSTAVTSSPAATLTVNTPASITTQPSSITQCAGTSATFTVVAAGTAPLTYQWQKNGSNASGTSTNASYTINPIAAGDAGNYTVIVNNVCSTAVTSSPAATLTVNTPASITTQPSSITQCAGTSATFTVVAAGTAPLTYQWQKNGSNASGTSTNASYTINPIAAGDAGNYTVIVNNVCSTAVTSSPAATLTVNTPASITTQPTSLSRCVGGTATFTVVAAGTAPLTYQWQKNGSNASGTSTNASYTINPVATGDAGNYTVIVNNVCSTAVTSSPAAVLTVNSPITSIAGSPQTICNSTIASLAGNNPSPGTGLWTLSSGTGSITTPSSESSGVTGLTVGGASTFTWTITNGACTTSSNVTITVSSPATADAGPDQALCNVTSTTLAATGTGTWSTVSGTGVASTPSSATSNVTGLTIGGSTTMKWTVVNGACSASSNMVITVSAPGSANAGADQVLCNTSSTTLAAAGIGTWTKISGSGTVTNPVSATSGVTGLTVGGTSVFEWSVSAGACSGTDQVSITVSAPATGSAGANQSICGATTANLSATGTGTWSTTSGTGVVTNPNNPSSAVTGLTVGASSVFTWTVTNGACSTATTTTIASNAPVSITTQPAASTTLCTGNTLNLNVVATGSGTLTYQWKKGVSNASGTSTGSSYSIPSVVFGDAGNYTVEVTNSCGTVTSSIAQLNIQNLAITTQPSPASQAVCPTANVSYTVAATGPSVSYQWKKDNVDLLSQTSSTLNLNNVSTSDAGSYTVLVSGCSNSILSNAAVLTVSVCTGITDETNNNRFRVYPNPASTTLHLNGFAQDPIKSLMIVDVNGEVVYQERDMSAASYEVSVASYTQGLYHIILFTASGNKWVEKIEVAK